MDHCRSHYCSLTQVTTWTSSCPHLSLVTLFPGSLDTLTQRVSWQASRMLTTCCYFPGYFVQIAFRSLFDAYFLGISTVLEETGSSLEFLHTRLHSSGVGSCAESIITIYPKQPNVLAIYARERFKQSRAPIFIDSFSTPKSMLRRFLVPHLHVQNGLLWDRAEDAVRHLSILLLEIRQCLWPDRTISECLLCLPVRHDSTFFMVARRAGRTIRKNPRRFWEMAWSAVQSVKVQLYA